MTRLMVNMPAETYTMLTGVCQHLFKTSFISSHEKHLKTSLNQNKVLL